MVIANKSIAFYFHLYSIATVPYTVPDTHWQSNGGSHGDVMVGGDGGGVVVMVMRWCGSRDSGDDAIDE